ncbi:ArsR family transcriptional regulator [Candidatus Woesearchaeota archaeon]|nr:ArsR family transcriptional regulator [Candidatus Woesearchaeota archaeon]
MGYVVIAPVGDNIDALFVGLKEFPTERVVLITPPSRVKDALRVKKDLERFKIPAAVEEVAGNFMEATFEVIARVKQIETGRDIIVNVATGDRVSTCAALSAAFVNGLKAFGVEHDKVMLLPILRFSYYKMLTDRKLGILKLLFSKGNKTFEELEKETRMSLPLISYHINGNQKAEGLKQLGLVEVVEGKGKPVKSVVQLTMLGRLLVKGYI